MSTTVDWPVWSIDQRRPDGPSCRAATVKRTFGLQRAEVLAALGSALVLVGVEVWVLIQAVDRLRSSVEIDSRLMLVVAFIGVLANLGALLVLRPAQAKSPEHAWRLSRGAR